MTKTKWVRDTNGDRYCAWHLVDASTEDSDNAIASVHPEWSATQTWGRGQPVRWTVIMGGVKWGTTYPTVRAATKAVDHQRAMSLAPRV